MAKLDDFGRPIYETAEEYNKAHKGGVCPRPYDSPEGENYQHKPIKGMNQYKSVAQRHATVQGSKDSKRIVLVIAVCVVVFNIAIIFSVLSSVFESSHVDYEQGYVTEEFGTEGYDEYLGGGDIALPENFEVFSYNGGYYRLPTDYGRISQMGFVIEDYSENDTFPAGYEEMLGLYDEDGFMIAMIRISNYTETEIPLKECLVDYFYIENPMVYDETKEFPEFSFGEGISFKSSYEDLEEYLGAPYWHYWDYSEEGYEYDVYQWMYYPEKAYEWEEQEDIQFVEVRFFNGVIESISLEKKAYEEK